MPGEKDDPTIVHTGEAALRLSTGGSLSKREAEPGEMTLEAAVRRDFVQLRVPIYRYLVIGFGRPAEAEEIVQDAFYQYYKCLAEGRVIHYTRGWLFQVSHNLAINRRKHEKFFDPLVDEAWQRLEQMHPDPAPNPEQRLLQREKFTQIHRAMKQLTLQERQCMHLRAEGFRYREIGEILGISDRTVNEYLRRAIRKLKERG
jgi:RNA polymerase sigma-70 factor, ECF subfamily